MLSSQVWRCRRFETPGNSAAFDQTLLVTDASYRIAVRLGLATLLVGVIVFAIQWTAGTGLEEGRFVNDFRVFRGAGVLVADGQWNAVFDREALGEAAFGPGERAVFLNPPPWAAVFAVFSMVSVALGATAWLVLGGYGYVAGLRALGASWAWVAGGLVSVPALVTIELGQNALLSTALVALAAYALLDDHPGLLAVSLVGLFYKPYFAVGLALAALVTSPAMRRAMLAVAAGWTALAVASFALVPDFASLWAENWEFLREVVVQHESAAVSLLATTGPAWLRSAAAVAIGVVGVIGFVRLLGSQADQAVVVAGAAALGVWVSPHLLIYDWLVLVVPLVVIATKIDRRVAAGAGAALAVTALVAAPLERLQFDAFGGWVGVASLGLIVTTVWVWRSLRNDGVVAES